MKEIHLVKKETPIILKILSTIIDELHAIHRFYKASTKLKPQFAFKY